MSVSCMEYCVILYVKDNLINILFPVVAIVPLKGKILRPIHYIPFLSWQSNFPQ